MNAATERMTEVLKARDWEFEVNEETKMVSTGCNGKNGQWKITTGGLEDVAVLILSRFPVNCPEAKRKACAELFARINFGAPAVSFELDLNDGEILCKTSVLYDKEPPQVELLDKLFSFNMAAMDHHFPAIMSVIYAGTSPARALANLEKASEKPKKNKGPKVSRKARFQLN